MIAQLAVWLLGRKSFSEKDRIILTNALLRGAGAFPLRAVIGVDANQRMTINGKPVSLDDMATLRDTADTALRSPARKLVHEQVRFMAIDKGFLQTEDPKVQLFYKAALWFAQEETELLKQMAGNPDLSTG